MIIVNAEVLSLLHYHVSRLSQNLERGKSETELCPALSYSVTSIKVVQRNVIFEIDYRTLLSNFFARFVLVYTYLL